MYGFCMNATEICGCGILRITIIVNSFTCCLFETTTTDIRIYLRTKYSQLRLCLPNRLWSILHIILHQSMALVRARKPLLHQGCEHIYSCVVWDFKVILQFSLSNGSVFALWFPKSTDVHVSWGFPGGASGKEPICQCRRYKRYGLDPWARKISWKGEHGNPLQYPCLRNPMDVGARWALVHRIPKSWTQCKWLSTAHESL